MHVRFTPKSGHLQRTSGCLLWANSGHCPAQFLSRIRITSPKTARAPMKVLRLYADALGESRFETTTIPMALKEFAPPAAPLYVSDPQPAQNYVILEVGAKWGGAVPHPSPARMMAFSLSGCTRVTASSGETHTFVAGDCLLHDDTSGKGHSTEVISAVPARCVFIRLPN